MKPLFITLLLAICLIPAKARPCISPQNTLADGLYYANVAYYNYATFVSADYMLKLRVRDGIVSVIYLNNGGILHNRPNGSNYQYIGGKLVAKKDKHTDKLEYTAQVTITSGTVITSYSISILKEAPDEQGDGKLSN
jgi:hypothetical protein